MTTETSDGLVIDMPIPHKFQRAVLDSSALSVVVRGGRRGGKTTLAAIMAVKELLTGGHILYAAPTSIQTARFWNAVKTFLAQPLAAGVLSINNSTRMISLPFSDVSIRAVTGWNPDTIRSDYASLLILDEFQLMSEDVLTRVGMPMLLDKNGKLLIIYTPPTQPYRGHAHDPRFISKLYREIVEGKRGDTWAAVHFSSHDNPYIKRTALDRITRDMTDEAYRQEIMAEDLEDDPHALWQREWIEHNRTTKPPELTSVFVGVDPAGTEHGDAIGIVTGGVAKIEGELHFYVLNDATLHGRPEEWAREVVAAYYRHGADLIVAEANFGGDMVESTIHSVDPRVPVKLVRASRGKRVRAEPVSVLYKRGLVHHVGAFRELEDELCSWVPLGGRQKSPNRLDALVWIVTEAMLGNAMPPVDGVQLSRIAIHRGGRDKKSLWRKGL